MQKISKLVDTNILQKYKYYNSGITIMNRSIKERK